MNIKNLKEIFLLFTQFFKKCVKVAIEKMENVLLHKAERSETGKLSKRGELGASGVSRFFPGFAESCFDRFRC